MTKKIPTGSTSLARNAVIVWISKNLPDISKKIEIGLPEYNDRKNEWDVCLLKLGDKKKTPIGMVRLNYDSLGISKTTRIPIILNRFNNIKLQEGEDWSRKKRFRPTPVPNKVVLGDSSKVLEDFPVDTAQLIFTSPPYYNTKPEYSEYLDYKEYLHFLRKVFLRCHSVLSEGRFIVVNVSPILVKRVSRNTASKRIPIPYDIHFILNDIGFDFIDDIYWVKPEGAGWSAGRGRRFAADRQPLQYKPVPVTEHIMVYRKKTNRLIDWNLRNHYDPSLIEVSKIHGKYDKTNLWHIAPSSSKVHPATFPKVLADKVIKYYSFEQDLVLDPFAGVGTVAYSALNLNRRFLCIERELAYFNHIKENLLKNFNDNIRIDFDVHENFEEEE